METIIEHRGSGSPSALETHLGYWMRRVSNRVSGEFALALRDHRVSVAEWVALRLIQQHEQLTPAQLADRIGMTRGAVSKVAEKLESKGWVTRRANAEDDRSRWLTLTRLGKLFVPKLAELADKNDQHFFGCLNKGDQAALRRILEKLTDFHHFREVPVE